MMREPQLCTGGGKDLASVSKRIELRSLSPSDPRSWLVQRVLAGRPKVQWTKAENENNADMIKPLLAEKFIVTESDGQVKYRAEFLMEERKQHFSSSTIDDLKITVFGDTAIASYILDQKVVLGNALPRTGPK